MNKEDFEAHVVDFASRFPLPDSDGAGRPARWVSGTFGEPVPRVALRYNSSSSMERFNAFVDARSLADSEAWSVSWAEAWIEKNQEYLNASKFDAYRSEFLGRRFYSTERRGALNALLATFPWSDLAGPWGPGVIPVRAAYLERMQLLYLILRTLTQTFDTATAYSYLIGTNPILGNTSPLLHLATTGRQGGHEQLRALADVIDPDGVGPADSNRNDG